MAQKINDKWEIGKIYYVHTDDGVDSFWMPLEYSRNKLFLKSLVYFIEDGIWWAGSLEGPDVEDQIDSMKLVYSKPSFKLVSDAVQSFTEKYPKIEKKIQDDIKKHGARSVIQFCFADF